MKLTSLLSAASVAALSTAAAAQDADLLVFDYSGFEEPSYHQAYIDKLMDTTAVVRISIDHLIGKARK